MIRSIFTLYFIIQFSFISCGQNSSSNLFENSQIGYSYSHISNNDWGETNPGVDNQHITFSKNFYSSRTFKFLVRLMYWIRHGILGCTKTYRHQQ